MQINKHLKQNIQLITTLKELALNYQEISIRRMQNIRQRVINTRSYMENLLSVYGEVKTSYKDEIAHLQQHAKKTHAQVSWTTGNKNGKKALVLLSSNTKLYGDINSKVGSYFLKDIKGKEGEIIVLGNVGKEILNSHGIKNFIYFDLKDDSTPEELSKISATILEYENTTLYYGKFSNMMLQQADKTNISGNIEIETKEAAKEHLHFAFEPSLKEIVELFENQIASAFFTQAVRENTLARLASRADQMEIALVQIDKAKIRLADQLKKTRRNKLAHDQLERIAGISIWRHRR